MKKGFTLIELSIVFVIVGLLVGGLLVAQSMIRQVQLHSLVKDITYLGIQVSNFKMTYQAIPGEYLDAQTAWPLISGYCPSRVWLNSVPDGIINDTYENEGAFAQLYAAGFIEMGRRQIFQDSSSPSYWKCYANNMQQWAGYKSGLKNVYGQWTSLNQTNGLIYGYSAFPIATVAETLGLDQKFDDGLPNTGTIRGYRSSYGSGYCNLDPSDTGSNNRYHNGYLRSLTCYLAIVFPDYYLQAK